MAKLPTWTLALGCCLILTVQSRTEPKALEDRSGDPLPAGAKARLGTLRFRAVESPYFITVVSADGKKIIKAGNSDEVLTLDAITGKELRRVKLEKYTGALNNAVLSEDCSMFVGYGSNNTSLQIYELETGKELLVIPDLKNYRPDSLQLSADGSTVAMATVDQPPNKTLIDLWDTKTGKKRCQLESLHNSGVQMVLSQDGKRLANWGWSQPGGEKGERNDQEIARTIQIWDVETGKLLHKILSDEQQVTRAAISPNGKRLLISGYNSGIGVYSTETGKLERQIATRAGVGAVMSFAPDGQTFAAGNGMGLVQVWETESGKRLESCDGPWCPLVKIVFPPKGKVRVFAMDCQTLRSWEVSTQKAPEPVSGHTGPTNALCFLPGGKQIATTSHDSRIMIWDATTFELVKQIDRGGDLFNRGAYLPPNPAEFSADGKYLVGTSQQSAIAVYDAATGKAIFDLIGANLGHVRPALSANNLLAVPFQKQNPTGWEMRVAVWGMETGHQVRQFKLPWQEISSVAISPDGETVVALRSIFDQTQQPPGNVIDVVAWSVGTEKEKFKFKTPCAAWTGMSFAPDGHTLLIAMQNGLTLIGDTETGGGRKEISVDNEFSIFGSPVFAPDGRTFALARVRNTPTGIQSKIQIWETASRTVRQEFTAHAAYINSFTFSPDCLTLGSTSNDTTALLWDLRGSGDPAPAGKLEAKELADLWESLSNQGADVGGRALWRMVSAPENTVTFLRERLQAVVGDDAPTKDQIAKWIKELDDDGFDVREKATQKLTEAGKLAEKDLAKALESQPSAEASQRIKQILEKIATKDEPVANLRPLRALEVLERIGNADAKEIVKKLAAGKADARITLEAKETLKRWR